MNWQYHEERRAGTLTVASGLTIAQICPLKEALLRGLDEADQVTLDVGADADIDVAGLQLLCAAHRYARKQGKELSLSGIGERTRELARAAGFAHGVMCGGGNQACFWSKMA